MLALSVGLFVLLLSVWAGFRWSNRPNNDDAHPVSEPNTLAVVSEQLKTLELALANKSREYSFLENEVKGNVAEIELLGNEVKGHAAEIEALQESENYLNSQVELIRQEKLVLQQKLQDQELLFAEAKMQWQNATTERKVVYNITNIPVGGHVTEAQYESDVQALGMTSQTPEVDIAALPEFAEAFRGQQQNSNHIEAYYSNAVNYSSYDVGEEPEGNLYLGDEVSLPPGYIEYNPPESAFADIPSD